jgi:hypothetical protein
MNDPWAEDPEYPVQDWRYEVTNDDTRLGYLDWVAAQKQLEQTGITPETEQPQHDRCEICRNSRARFVPAVLYPLSVTSTKRIYVHWICADCVLLFNTNRWDTTRRVIDRELRSR